MISGIATIAAMVAVGAGLGAALGSTRSCTDGGCPLTANPKRGALWGGFLGLAMAVSLLPGAVGRTLGAAKDGEVSPFVEVSAPEAFKQEVLDRPGTAVVYFHATWCGACRQFSPIADRVAREHASEARYVKVDTDKADDLASEYRIKFLPTTVVFANGVEAKRLVGVASEKDLTDALQEAAKGTGDGPK